MGWVIRVGSAGAQSKQQGPQVMAVDFDGARLHAPELRNAADAWPARHIWRGVLATLIDDLRA